MKTHDERGSVLIETLTATVTLSLLVMGGLSLSYVAFARVWLERSAYEAVICLATSAGIPECRGQLIAATESALPVGQVSNLSLKKSARSAEVALRFEFLGRDVGLIRDRRALPLTAGAYP